MPFWPVLAVCGAIVVYVEGVGLLAVWNLLPLVVLHSIARDLLQAAGGGWRHVSFDDFLSFAGLAAFTLGVTLYVHGAWALDASGFRTEVANAGLIFTVLPLLSLAAGLAGYFAGWGLARALVWRWLA